MTTGAPTTSAMKTVRRDHSMSPRDTSKMRTADVSTPGARDGIVVEVRTFELPFDVSAVAIVMSAFLMLVGPHPHSLSLAGPARRASLRPLARAAGAYFTKYWKTAWRLSSGDVTSSIVPNSPLAAISVRRA